jgi:hypothetical protein
MPGLWQTATSEELGRSEETRSGAIGRAVEEDTMLVALRYLAV